MEIKDKEHWDWLEPILRFIGRPLTIEEVEYLYRTAMEHGYLHGWEDCENEHNKSS